MKTRSFRITPYMQKATRRQKTVAASQKIPYSVRTTLTPLTAR